MLSPADQRQRVGRVVFRVDDLVGAAENDGGSAGLAQRQFPPGFLLSYQGRVADAGHEGGHEARVVVKHPVDVAQDLALEWGRAIVRTGVGGFGEGGGDGVRGDGGGGVVGALAAGGDGPLQATLGNGGEKPLGDEAGGEDEASYDAEVLGADKPGRGEKDERGDHVWECGGEVDGDSATHAVADEPEGGRARPGEGRGGKGQKNLGGVEPSIMRQISDSVAEPSPEQVKEHDPTSLFFDQGVSQLLKRLTRRADAMNKDYLGARLRPPFIDAG